MSPDPEIFALKQVDISAPAQYEALYSPMTATVGLLGPLPRSDNHLQATMHTMYISDINDVLSKVRREARFL